MLRIKAAFLSTCVVCLVAALPYAYGRLLIGSGATLAVTWMAGLGGTFLCMAMGFLWWAVFGAVCECLIERLEDKEKSQRRWNQEAVK